MENARGNNRDGPSEYELQREATIASNKRKLEISIMNRAKLKLLHTLGSKSFACSRHELDKKLGRPARRDEVFIETHTRKNGVPSRQAESTISPRSEEHDDEVQLDVECDEDDGQSDEDQFLLVNRRPAAPAPSVQPINTNPSAPARNDVTRSPHDELVGKDVILHAVLRSDLPVAKGIITSTNPTTLVSKASKFSLGTAGSSGRNARKDA